MHSQGWRCRTQIEGRSDPIRVFHLANGQERGKGRASEETIRITGTGSHSRELLEVLVRRFPLLGVPLPKDHKRSLSGTQVSPVGQAHLS